MIEWVQEGAAWLDAQAAAAHTTESMRRTRNAAQALQVLCKITVDSEETKGVRTGQHGSVQLRQLSRNNTSAQPPRFASATALPDRIGQGKPAMPL